MHLDVNIRYLCRLKVNRVFHFLMKYFPHRKSHKERKGEYIVPFINASA